MRRSKDETNSRTIRVHYEFDSLSQRERQIAMFLKDRWSDKEIAQELRIKPSTIKTHTRHIFFKLGVHDRIELARRFQAQF